MPSGESISLFSWFPISRNAKGRRQFSSLNIKRANELVEEKILIIRPRVEIKVELRKTFRNNGKISSQTWHLASIMECNICNPIKCEAFWQKINNKLKNFELSSEEKVKILTKIETSVPRMSERLSKTAQEKSPIA